MDYLFRGPLSVFGDNQEFFLESWQSKLNMRESFISISVSGQYYYHHPWQIQYKDFPEEGNPVTHAVTKSSVLIFVTLMLKILCVSYLPPHLPSFTTCSLSNTLPKLQLIRESSSRQVLSVQILSQHLYCLENSPLGGAGIHCKHL